MHFLFWCYKVVYTLLKCILKNMYFLVDITEFQAQFIIQIMDWSHNDSQF